MDLTQTQTQVLKVSDLRPNAGELECIGVHANPRQISESDYAKLLTSMRTKNMTGVLPLKVFNHEGTWYVLGGNMRLRAMQELGIEQVSCIVVPADTDAETLNEIIIKDNATFGEWDMDALANWDEPLAEWGVDVPSVGLPEELQGLDIAPDEIEKITGDGKTDVERIIIVYKGEKSKELAALLGVASIEKVVYRFDGENIC